MSETRNLPAPDLAALVGSRICHDLISPLGAIGNGLELLTMAGGEAGPELALIGESVANANARIRFFRVAFGQAGAEARLGRPEIASILADVTRGSRLAIDWQAEGDMTRREVKLAFLLIQCLETALPYGGTITVGREGEGWQVRGRGDKLRVEPGLWAWLTGEGTRAEIAPAQVQFALAADEAARRGRRFDISIAPEDITVSW